MQLMGCRFEISAVTTSADHGKEAIQAAEDEMRRIERLLTTYDEDSETSLINRNAGGKPVTVSLEIIGIIQRSIRISELTAGAFDITYGGIDKSLWNFDPGMQRLPDSYTARKMVRLINFRNILMDRDNNTVLLKEKGMRIGFGGIGKGYAAERAKVVMLEMGVDAGMDLINQMNDIEAVLIDDHNNLFTSNNIHLS